MYINMAAIYLLTLTHCIYTEIEIGIDSIKIDLIKNQIVSSRID